MYKKTITYPNYNGDQITEDFYFNLTRAEIMEMELGTEGGLENMLTRIVNAQDLVELSRYFKKIILMSYGEKSPDGKRFIKERHDGSKPCNDFKQTEAFSMLYMELATDSKAASEFINAIIPDEYLSDSSENSNAQLAVVNKE